MLEIPEILKPILEYYTIISVVGKSCYDGNHICIITAGKITEIDAQKLTNLGCVVNGHEVRYIDDNHLHKSKEVPYGTFTDLPQPSSWNL